MYGTGMGSGSGEAVVRIIQGAFISDTLFLRRNQMLNAVPTLVVGSVVAFATVPGTNLEDLEEDILITLKKNQVYIFFFLGSIHSNFCTCMR